MRRGLTGLALGLATVLPLRAQLSVSELKALSLEQLMELEVTSVSRRPEPFHATAGAVSVLTGREIAQTGATHVADALRYAPGVQVARIDTRTWAVSVRGFNAANPNKLLVLVDGRTVYTPLFSGVPWEAQDFFLPDLDRIEIVRGPGATLWGANAVNGVLSFTSKEARYTQGGLVTAGAGTEERLFGGIRYGGEVEGKYFYRVYAKSVRREPLSTNSGVAGNDAWRMGQVGFRVDSARAPEDGTFTVQGDYYDGWFGEDSAVRLPASGGNLLVRGTRSFTPELGVTLQAYFDHVSREVHGQFGEERDTYDLDAQLNWTGWEQHDVVAGLNARTSRDDTTTRGVVQFAPVSRRLESFGAFVQDEIRWADGRFGLVVGSKFEHHDSVGFEVQPSIRAAVRDGHNTWWTSISRAVRTPSRYDEDHRFPSVARPITSGSRDFRSEVVVAYEAGYRGQPFAGLLWDVSLFFNDYDRLRSLEPPSGRGPRLVGNGLKAHTYGGEVSVTWKPIARWQVTASYSRLEQTFGAEPWSRDLSLGTREYNDPKQQASLRSALHLPHGFEFDFGIRYVDELPHPYQPDYTTADARLVWRSSTGVELSVVGQNLAEASHTEFGSDAGRQVERSFHASITWQF